jgi:hypothetical protein
VTTSTLQALPDGASGPNAANGARLIMPVLPAPVGSTTPCVFCVNDRYKTVWQQQAAGTTSLVNALVTL